MTTRRPRPLLFRVYVLLVLAAWLGVLVAALWGLDWRWIPTALVAAVVLLMAGGLVENHLFERSERRRLAVALEEARQNPGRWMTEHLGAPKVPGLNR